MLSATVRGLDLVAVGWDRTAVASISMLTCGWRRGMTERGWLPASPAIVDWRRPRRRTGVRAEPLMSPAHNHAKPQSPIRTDRHIWCAARPWGASAPRRQFGPQVCAKLPGLEVTLSGLTPIVRLASRSRRRLGRTSPDARWPRVVYG